MGPRIAGFLGPLCPPQATADTTHHPSAASPLLLTVISLPSLGVLPADYSNKYPFPLTSKACIKCGSMFIAKDRI